MRIALIEAGHWHVPLYLPAFTDSDLRLVAVSDSETSKAQVIAKRFGADLYRDYREMLDKAAPDFVFAFGRHADMPAIAQELIARRIPFAIEKPCGRSAADVHGVRMAAEQAGVYVAIPYVLRYTDVIATIRRAVRQPFLLRQAAFRFIAGPISRYDAAECSWLRDRTVAGGGSTINVGHHFYDMLIALAGEPITSVSAALRYDGSIEDYSQATLRTAGGLIATIETGYLFPSSAEPGQQRDFSVRLSTDGSYLVLENDELVIRDHGAPPARRATSMPIEMDAFYPVFARQAVADWHAGLPPRAGLGHLEEVMKVMDAVYASADRDGMPVITI